MMDGIRQWLLGILAAAMGLSLLYALLPKGAVRAAAKAAGGLILLLAVLGPAAGLDLSDLAVRYEDLSRDMEQQAETYRREGQAQLELGIRQRTAAYISEKAAQLGLSCHPRVEVTWRGGVRIRQRDAGHGGKPGLVRHPGGGPGHSAVRAALAGVRSV